MTATDQHDAPPGADSPPPEPAAPVPPPDAGGGPRLVIPGGIAAIVPDNVDLITGGTIKIVAEGETRTLRRPSMEEFKALRESREALVRIEAQRRKDNLDEDGLPTDGLPPDMTTEIETWVAYAISLLAAEGPLPATAIPPWLSNPTLINDFISHWREVPYRNK